MNKCCELIKMGQNLHDIDCHSQEKPECVCEGKITGEAFHSVEHCKKTNGVPSIKHEAERQEEATTSDWEGVAKSMWDSFPLFEDWTMFIRGLIAKERTQAKKELNAELRGKISALVKKCDYCRPGAYTAECTVVSENYALEQVLALLPEQPN